MRQGLDVIKPVYYPRLCAQVALKEMLALHDKGLSSQLMLEERQLYFRQVVSAIQEALGCPHR